MQARTYSVGITMQSPSDKYAVLAGVDTAATAINWTSQMNTTCQSSEFISDVSIVAPEILLIAVLF